MTGLYRTDTEALHECLRLMFPDCEADDFRTEGGNINMPKIRSLWANRRALLLQAVEALEAIALTEPISAAAYQDAMRIAAALRQRIGGE